MISLMGLEASSIALNELFCIKSAVADQSQASCFIGMDSFMEYGNNIGEVTYVFKMFSYFSVLSWEVLGMWHFVIGSNVLWKQGVVMHKMCFFQKFG